MVLDDSMIETYYLDPDIVINKGGKDFNSAKKCGVWPLDEPALLNPIKWYDQMRYKSNPSNTFRLPWWLKIIRIPWRLTYCVYFLIKVLIFKVLRLKPQ